jgi:sugar lactone lactonase YvrE
MGPSRPALIVALCLAATPATAALTLPPGFSVEVYVTGDGFEAGVGRGTSGIPATSTLAFDRSGVLYLARTGRRYWAAGEWDDLSAVYRVPVGGSRLTPPSEASYHYGPPLPNPQVAAIRAGRELFVTTFDRDRKIGVLYRMLGPHPELFAGGTPPRGAPPLLRQPEGAALDSAGNVYVADRAAGTVVRLDPTGRVLDPRWVSVTRPRVLAMDAGDRLWIGADGSAEAPWQRGPGEIWRVDPHGAAKLVVRGPIPAGIALSPSGYLFVADRHAGEVFAVTAQGQRVPFAAFSDGDAPRSLAFAPVSAETRRAGVAGDLFLVVIRHGAWPVNEVIRISGPFDDLVRERLAATP